MSQNETQEQVQVESVRPIGPLDAFWNEVNQNPSNPNILKANLAAIQSAGRMLVHFAMKVFPDRSAEE